MSPSKLRHRILATTPIGTDRKDVEKALTDVFRRKWHVVNGQSVELISMNRFHTDVSEGDYYFRSNFAAVASGILIADVVTIRFLFDQTDKLKDFAVEKWGDGP